jgi:tetratricopeptide (TPR) repeat protein
MVYSLFTLLFPVVFFLLVEGSLRILGYGPDLSLFTTERIGEKTYLVMNPAVKSRYFARVEFTPTSSMDYFLPEKPPGTFRIFCLGGSTTVGFPYGYAGAFSTFLRERLLRTFPDRDIEVINLGMTATNSFTVADILRELPPYSPDLIIVYDGHNEFYGALGAASLESVGQSRWLVRLYLRAIRWKAFLALREFYNRIRGSISGAREDPGGTMMERLARGQVVPEGSPTYRQALATFRANLDEVAAIAREHHIPLILGTQVSNLRDFPPFISQHPASLSPAGRLEFATRMNNGFTFRADRMLDSSLASFEKALEVDSARADVHFQVGKALDTLSRPGEASPRYVRARDLDLLRFRASTDFNREISLSASPPWIFVADMERKFRANSRGGNIGGSLILEHLHPNLRGQYLMAKEFTRVMREAGILADTAAWSRRDTIADDILWEDRSVTRLDEMCAERRILALISGWPFREDEARIPPLPEGGLNDIVRRMTRAEITWEEAHVAAAEFYRKGGDRKNLEREYRALIGVLPVNVSAYLLLGDLEYKNGELGMAWDVLRRSLKVERTHFALNTLGAIALQVGNPDSAFQYLRQARVLAATPEEQMRTGYLLGTAYASVGNASAARDELERVLRQNPGFSPALKILEQLRGRP